MELGSEAFHVAFASPVLRARADVEMHIILKFEIKALPIFASYPWRETDPSKDSKMTDAD